MPITRLLGTRQVLTFDVARSKMDELRLTVRDHRPFAAPDVVGVASYDLSDVSDTAEARWVPLAPAMDGFASGEPRVSLAVRAERLASGDAAAAPKQPCAVDVSPPPTPPPPPRPLRACNPRRRPAPSRGLANVDVIKWGLRGPDRRRRRRYCAASRQACAASAGVRGESARRRRRPGSASTASPGTRLRAVSGGRGGGRAMAAALSRRRRPPAAVSARTPWRSSTARQARSAASVVDRPERGGGGGGEVDDAAAGGAASASAAGGSGASPLDRRRRRRGFLQDREGADLRLHGSSGDSEQEAAAHRRLRRRFPGRRV